MTLAVVHHLTVGLHHYIDDGPSKARSSVPRDTNSQGQTVKASGLTHTMSGALIVGYDDIEFAAAAAVPLSSVRQPRDELGRRGAELLYEELGALESGRPVEHQHIRFQPELIVRLSSA